MTSSANMYPLLDDDNFNIKITLKDEFNSAGSLLESNTDDDVARPINIQADELCNQTFQHHPHQIFVKNFLSTNTPYNSLLLFHGVGTGKTCSAISISEEYRQSMKATGNIKKILIVASPNVQENFRKQIFNENMIEEDSNNEGYFKMNTCVGNDLLHEINPNGTKMKKETLISQANAIIDRHYEFVGYRKFGTLIDGHHKRNNLKKIFAGRMIIIDEVHNIRMNQDDENKKTAKSMNLLVEEVKYMRLMLLSATPMYNSHREILWLINLMNMNDNRTILNENEVFDEHGNFIIDENGHEVGKRNLMRKMTGYVSFVRGENPYSFPYRMYPSTFQPEKSLLKLQQYPRKQYNGNVILEPIKYVDVYCNTLKGYQNEVYHYIQRNLFDTQQTNDVETDEMNIFNLENKGYTRFQRPLNALNIVFPDTSIVYNKAEQSYTFNDPNLSAIVGQKGLENVITNVKSTPFKYNEKYLEDGKSIFHETRIGNFSSKIESILNNINTCDGIHLVYSQYIYGGIIPITCCLEEAGYSNYKTKKEFVDPSYKSKQSIKNNKGSYIIITGNQSISGNIKSEIEVAISEANKNGDIIKVVLISKAGSEGIDFKNIRNVHIMEPWYNMNRIEQIKGRGVRNCSHKHLEFKYRNVSMFMYGTYGIVNDAGEDVEALDMYLYRSSEAKAIKIGNVSRIMKESSVDCMLQHKSNNMTTESMAQEVVQVLSNNKEITYEVGDRPYTNVCDYMDTCDIKCNVVSNDEIKAVSIDELRHMMKNKDTFQAAHLRKNIHTLKQRIKDMFYENYVYHKHDIDKYLNYNNTYHPLEIELAIHEMVNDKMNIVIDKYKRKGYLIEMNGICLFQPHGIEHKQIPMEHRIVPVLQKREKIELISDTDSVPLHTKTERVNLHTNDVNGNTPKALIAQEKSFDVQHFNDTLNSHIENHVWFHTLSDRRNIKKVKDINVSQFLYEYILKIDKTASREEIERTVIPRFITFQYLDKEISFEDKLKLFKYCYENDGMMLSTHVFEYVKDHFFDIDYVEGFIISDYSKLHVFVYDNNNDDDRNPKIKANMWIQDDAKLKTLQHGMDEQFLLNHQLNHKHGHHIIGYYIANKSNKFDFKMQNTLKNTASRGIKCNGISSLYVKKYLNDALLGVGENNNEDALIMEQVDTLIKMNPNMTNANICHLIELILRYRHDNDPHGRSFMMTSAKVIYNKMK